MSGCQKIETSVENCLTHHLLECVQKRFFEDKNPKTSDLEICWFVQIKVINLFPVYCSHGHLDCSKKAPQICGRCTRF
eukprot:UN17857